MKGTINMNSMEYNTTFNLEVSDISKQVVGTLNIDCNLRLQFHNKYKSTNDPILHFLQGRKFIVIVQALTAKRKWEEQEACREILQHFEISAISPRAMHGRYRLYEEA